MNQPKVAVCILNYNGMKANYLERFLPSVYASTYGNMDLYVIDNGSTDDSVAYLQSQGFGTPGVPSENQLRAAESRRAEWTPASVSWRRRLLTALRFLVSVGGV